MKNISIHAHKTKSWYLKGFSSIFTTTATALLFIYESSAEGTPTRGFGKQRNIIIYFKGARYVSGLISEEIEQGISLRKLQQKILGSKRTYYENNPEAAALEVDWARITES